MANNTPNIPSLSSKVDVEVKRAFEAIKSWFTQISSSGGVVTQAGLASGLADIPAIIPFLDSTIPPQLATFTATGAFRTIMLTWDDPRYSSFAFVEVWRATVNDLGVAVRIGTTQSTMYTDLPANSSLSVTYYYWVRVISKGNVTGPFNATAGTPASTANDPAYMLQVLANQLSATQLAVSLSSRIDLIDTPGTGLVASVDSLSVSILNSIPDTATWLNQLIREKAISDATVDINATTGVISLKALTANILPDDLVRINSLEFNLNAANGSILGHTNTLSAQADTLTSQDTRITQAEGNIGLKASTAYVDGKTQEVANLLGPDAAAMFGDDVPSALFWLLFAAKDAKDEARVNTASMAIAQFDLKSNADAVLAEAEARLLLVAKVDENYAALVEEMSVRAGADGLVSAQWTIKLDVNGKVAGVGLMNDGATSAMIVNVDKFAIAGTGAADAYPFIVVGGVTYIKAALIQDATITNAKIASLATDKLVAGSALIGTALIANAAITNAKIGTAAIGTAQIADAAITAAKIVDATITNAKIGAAAVDSLQIAGNAVTIPLGITITEQDLTCPGAWADIPGMAINITQVAGNTYPVLVTATADSGINTGGYRNYSIRFRIVRDGGAGASTIARGATSIDYGGELHVSKTMGVVFRDATPGVGPHWYTLQWYSETGTDISVHTTGMGMILLGAKR